MIENNIHTWLDYKFRHLRDVQHNYGTKALLMLFKGYINELSLACEARLNITNDVKN